MFNEKRIKEITVPEIYNKGKVYCEQGRVKNLTESEKLPGVFRAKVIGSAEYDVLVEVDKKSGKIEFYECNCPPPVMFQGACEHVVAALLALKQQQGGNLSVKLVNESFFELFSFPSTAEPLELCGELYVDRASRYMTVWAEFTVGRSRAYVIKNVYEFIADALHDKPHYFGAALTVNKGEYVFAGGKSSFFWQLLKDIYYEAESFGGANMAYYSTMWLRLFEKKRARLGPAHFKRVLGWFADNGEPVTLNLDGGAGRAYEVLSGSPPLEVTVAAVKGGAIVSLEPDDIRLLTDDGEYLIAGGQIYHTDADWRREAGPVLRAFAPERQLKLKKEMLGEFFSRVVPEMRKVARVTVADKLTQEYKIVPLLAEAFIDYYKDGVACKLLYHYGEQEINPCLQTKPVGGVVRDSLKEWRLEQFFERFGFEKENGRYVQENEERAYDFFTEGVPLLARLADVFYSDVFKKSPVQRVPRVSVGVSIGQNNLLEIRFSKEAFDFDELVNLLGSYRQKRRYHRLKDGTFVTLGEQQLAGLAELVENTGLKKGGDDVLTMPLYNAMYLDGISQEGSGLLLEPTREYRRLVKSVASPELLDLPVPDEVEGVLRDYQVTGFNWLSTLAAYGFGGILADDMGLGKTLQVIAFLLAHKTEQPALVIAPTSLMYNWLEEIAKFAPNLKACAIYGSKAEREARLAEYGNYDVVITTYNLLKRDIDMYEAKDFGWCFLDEAQYIKNPTTQAARTVKRLKTGGYFALTGTPIENTLTELWSIFDFLMPGYLGGHKKFKQRYETPIVRAQDERAAQDLARHIAPFILRRLKKDVLSELPDKVETKLIAEMEPPQLKVYMAYLAQAKKDFAKELKAHGFEASRIKILSILTRLRQIACDPSLFLENYEGGAAKLDLLLDIVEQAKLSGHRMLIFSQFVTLLHHIAARLEAAAIEYCYLDGQTPAAERLELVNDFNSGTVPVFLISLKAGGTGLNLTGADMVIHCDPWWNPAVEDQATDRAYRLGQEKKVQVIKLITKDTIEEKIFALQEAKKALIDKMIQPGESFITKLSEEEIRELFE